MGLLIDVILVALLVAAFNFSSTLLGPRRRLVGERGLPYETGMPPLDSASDRMSVAYVRFAVLFVIFDVDLAFLLPWIGARRELDLAMMVSVTVFLGLIGLMLAYVWRKGALEC